jgi:hypothetical protein
MYSILLCDLTAISEMGVLFLDSTVVEQVTSRGGTAAGIQLLG